MKRLLLQLFLLSVPFLFLTEARADHVIGSDITYTCLDSGKYKIVMKFYRDCNGCYVLSQPAPFCGTSENCNSSATAPTSLTVQPIGSCGTSFPATVSMTRTSIIDITPTCKQVNSRCTPPCGSTYPYGIEEHTFEGVVDLSNYKNNGCCKVRISVQLSVRSVIITTGQAGNTFWTSCEIDVCQSPCNNSPILSNKPIAIVCCNQPYAFNNGAVDSLDMDSLSYAKATPYSGVGTPTPFAPGLSTATPVPVFQPGPCTQVNQNYKPPIGYYLNPQTGDLIFTPASSNCNSVGCPWIGIVAIDIIEWRRINGTMTEIGRTRRDMQFIAQNCPDNNPPTLSDSGTNSVCEGEQICIVIRSDDKVSIPPPPTTPPAPDTVTLTWNNGIPGASFTIISPTARLQAGRFCWTPAEGKASTIPYQFTVTARDNACPVNATYTKSYSIKVNPKPKATRTFTLLPCGKLKIEVTSTGTLKTVLVEIRDSINPLPVGPEYVNRSTIPRAIDTVQFRKGGRYIFSTKVTNTYNCASLYLDTLDIPPLLEVDLALADTFVCAGKAITLNAQVKNGLSPFRYRWGTGNPNDTLVTMTFDNVDHDSITYITVTDKNGCVAFDTALIKYVPLPVLNLGQDQRICDYDSVTLDALNPGHTITWSTGDTTQDIVVRQAGKYFVKVTDSLGCFKQDTMELFVNKHVAANAGSDNPICINDSYLLQGLGKDTAQSVQNSYTWNNADNGQSVGTKDTVRVSPTVTTNYEFVLRITEQGVTCVDRDTVNIRVNPLPTLTKGSLDDKCYNYGTINFAIEQAFLPAGGRYYYMKDTDNIMLDRRSVKTWELNPTPTQTVDAMITYIYQDPTTGCIKIDSIRQRILKMPDVRVKDTTYCLNVGPVNLRNHVLAPVFVSGSELWKCLNVPDAVTKDAANNYIFDPTKMPPPYQYTLTYRYTDGNGCYQEDTALINVIDIPVITSLENGPYCFNSGLVDLNAESGVQPTGGRWICRTNPNLILGNGTLTTDLVEGTFTLIYEHDLTGCLVVDSTDVTINALPYVETSIPAGSEQVCRSTPAFDMISTPAAGGTWSSAYPGLVTTAGRVDPSAKPDDGQVTGLYRVIFTYTDPTTGCTSLDSETISIQEPPTIDVVVTAASLCEGQPFSLKATAENAGNGITWTTNGTNTFSPDNQSTEVTYQPSAADNFPGNITATATTNLFGVCPQASETVALTINPLPRGRMGNDHEGCAPLDVDFDVQVDTPATGVTYRWTFGDPGSGDNTSTLKNPSHSYVNEGNYTVTLILSTDKGCADTITRPNYVRVYPVPVADFDVDPADRYTTIALPKFMFINKSHVSTGTLSYSWDFGQIDSDKDTSSEKDPVWYYGNQVEDTGAYIVTLVVTTDQGCKAIDTVTVVVGPELTIFIPNAFSPGRNGEAKNNKFYVTGQGFASFEMQIYNRWGEKLYQTNNANPDYGWTGSYKGAICQQDVYVYQVTVTNYAGKQFKYSGTVTLLR